MVVSSGWPLVSSISKPPRLPARMPAAILNGVFLSHPPQHAVPQHGFSVHAHLQPHLHDAPDRPLVRLPSVPRPNASGFSFQLLGGD